METGKKYNCTIDSFRARNILDKNNISISIFCKALNLKYNLVIDVLSGRPNKTNIDTLNSINKLKDKQVVSMLKIYNAAYGRTGKWKELV